MTFTFQSDVKHVTNFDAPYTVEAIKNEQMLFSSTYGYTLQNAGPITLAFLNAFSNIVTDVNERIKYIFDSRVHMLMPGWYPAIPGFHHDHIRRTREDRQPNYYDSNNESENYLAVVSTENNNCKFDFNLSSTEFIRDTVKLKEPLVGKTIYQEWDNILSDHVEKNPHTLVNVLPQAIYKFNEQSFHRAVPAKYSGWRFFIRASKIYKPEFKNEIRRQTQVYLPCVNKGW